MDIKKILFDIKGLDFQKEIDKYESAFRQICEEFDPVEYLNSEAVSIFNNNRHNTRVLTNTELIVSRCENLDLSLYFLNQTPADTVSTLGQHLFIKVFQEVSNLELYDYGKNDDGETVLLDSHPRQLCQEDILIINADKQLFSYSGDLEVPMLVLKIERDNVINYQFDKVSRKLQLKSPIYPMITQLKSAADLLGNFGGSTHLDGLKVLLDYKYDPTVRWAALQAIAMHSKEETLNALEKLSTDEDPQVSGLARKNLDRALQNA